MNVNTLIDESPLTNLQRTVIAVCFTLNMLDGMDVLAIAYAAPMIIEQWSVSPGAFGLVFSAGLVGMAAGAMFLGPLADVFGRRTMLLASAAAVAVGMLVTALANEVWELVALRLFTGLGIGSMLASMTSMVAEYSPRRVRSFAVSFVNAGYPVGATLTGAVAAWLVPEFGWRALFVAAGVVTAAMIPLVWLLLPESLNFLIVRRPRNALKAVNRILKRMGHAALERLPERAEGSQPSKASVRSLFQPAYRMETTWLWTAFFMAFFVLYYLLSWVPTIAVEAGLGLGSAISAGAAFNFGGVIGIVMLGYLSTRFGLRDLIFAFLLCAAAMMLVFGWIGGPAAVVLAETFVMGFLVMGGFIGLYAAAAHLYPTEFRTTGVGWAIGAGRSGAILGPYLGGLVIDAGWSLGLSFTVFAVPCVLAGFAARAMKLDVREKKAPEDAALPASPETEGGVT